MEFLLGPKYRYVQLVLKTKNKRKKHYDEGTCTGEGRRANALKSFYDTKSYKHPLTLACFSSIQSKVH